VSIRKRIEALERRFRDRGPSLEEVGAAFQRIAKSARAKLRGDSVDENQRAKDRDTVDRWEKAEGVDLENEAQRAREKLEAVDRARE
jgi:hypothetical protein